jgi:hypothetical protein
MVVAAVVLLGLIALHHDYRIPGPELNDRVLHKALVTYVADHWSEHWPVDSWYPPISGGFAMFAHYQHLSHLTAAALSRALPIAVDAARVYAALAYLILAFLPAVIFVSLRKLGLGPWVAAIGASLYPLVRAVPFFGIGWESYLHHGSGMLPQLWGVLFAFPALAWGYRAVRDGRVYVAGLLLGLCALSHTIYGYMAAISLGLLVVLPDRETRWYRRLGRLAGLGAVAFAVSAYFIVPLLMHADLVLRSQLEPVWKWDSIGWWGVLDGLARARIFDGGSWPIVSALVAFGIGVSALRVIRSRDRVEAWLISGFVLWVLLFAGRAGWGGIIDLLPVSSGLHMHRFLGGIQLFGLPLAAIGLHAVFRALVARPRWAAGIGIVLVLAALSLPVFERAAYLRENARIAATRRAALDADADFDELVRFLRSLPPGRVHAGMYYDWGREFRIHDIPLYTQLQAAGLDMVGYLFMAMAQPGEWQVRVDLDRLPPNELYNARYLVAPAGMPVPEFARPLQRFGRYAVFEVPSGGYFGLGAVESLPTGRHPDGSVRGASWLEVYDTGLEWIRGPALAEGRYLAMDGPVTPLGDRAGVGEIEGETISPGRFGCTVTVAEETDVIVKATHHPFWRCAVDGRTTPITRIFPSFMAVRVPGGTHRVQLEYRPPGWKKALFVLSLSMLVAGLLAPVLRGWRRRAAPHRRLLP